VSDIVVFIDAQNLYNDARRAFHRRVDPATRGQVDPMRLGRMLVAKQPHGAAVGRRLKEVRVYRGRPESSKEPQTYGAHMRQCDAWEKAGATVIARPLRYPRDWPESPAEEKGIDVQIAIDMVTMSMRGELDVAVLVSTDTDLRPVLEAFFLLPFEEPKTIEVAAFRTPTFSKSLRVPERHVWVHFLEGDDYQEIRDTRDYNLRAR
jgi:uncharacterized LabA/DUF88 family protein